MMGMNRRADPWCSRYKEHSHDLAAPGVLQSLGASLQACSYINIATFGKHTCRLCGLTAGSRRHLPSDDVSKTQISCFQTGAVSARSAPVLSGPQAT